MDKEELKKVFHLMFNKINNICIIAASNTETLKQEGLDRALNEESRKRAYSQVEALSRIEENARSLNSTLEGLYKLLTAENNS